MRKLIRKILVTGIIASLSVTPVFAAESDTVVATLQQNFDANYYASVNPDVAAALGTDASTLLNHYLTFGIKEGRQISATFDAPAYVAQHPEVANGTVTTTTTASFDTSSLAALKNNVYPAGLYAISEDLIVLSFDREPTLFKLNQYESSWEMDDSGKWVGNNEYGPVRKLAMALVAQNRQKLPADGGGYERLTNGVDSEGHYYYIYQIYGLTSDYNTPMYHVYIHTYQ